MDKNKKRYIYVLIEEDYGGTFSSNDDPVAASESEELAKEWASKYRYRTYRKVPIIQFEAEK